MRKYIIIITSLTIWSGCDDVNNSSPCADLLDNNRLILCEGSFDNNNASLWSFEPQTQNSECIQYQEIGDVAQSMMVYNNNLYIVLNNSHKIEVYNIGSELTYQNTLFLENSSPRYITSYGSLGYVSSWNLEAILVFDLNTLEMTDTIYTPGIPENLLINEDILYTSIFSKSGWVADTNLVIAVNLINNEIVSEYNVVNGPRDLKFHDNHLYVSGSITTSWPNNITGISKINLSTAEVLTQINEENTNIQNGLSLLNGNLFKTTSEGLVPVLDDLTLDFDNIIIGGENLSFASVDDSHIYFTKTDYRAPDTLKVTTHTGELVNNFIVGIAPKQVLLLND